MAMIMKLGPLAAQIDLGDWTKHATEVGGFAHQLDYKHDSVVMPRTRRSKPLPSGAGERIITLNLWVRGATKANLAANWREISAQLELCRRYMGLGDGAPVYLEYRPDGASASVLFEVLDGFLPPFPGGGQIRGEWIQNAQLMLYCNPYARGVTAVTDTSGTLAFNGTLQTAVLDSDCATPARVRVQNKTSGAEYDYIVVATRSRGDPRDFFDHYIASTNASTLGLGAHYASTANPVTISPYGVFKLNIRVQVVNPGDKGRFQLVYQPPGSGTQYDLGQEIEVTTTGWTDLVVTIPFNPVGQTNWQVVDFYTGSVYGYVGLRKVGTTVVRVSKFSLSYGTMDIDLTETAHTDNPTATDAGIQWTVTGAGSAHAALADNSDSSYIGDSTNGHLVLLGFQPALLSAGHQGARFIAYPSILKNWDLESTPNDYSAGVPVGSNLVASRVDPGFEGGFSIDGSLAPNGFQIGLAYGLSGERLVGVDVDSGTHGGSHAQGLLGSGYGLGLYVNIPMVVGQRYRFAVWVKVDNIANGIYAKVLLRDGVNQNSDMHNPDFPYETALQSTSWQEVTYDFTALSINLLVYFQVPYTPAAFGDMAVYDDLSLTQLGQTPDGWIMNGTIAGRKVPAITHGTDALLVGAGDSGTNYFSQAVPVANGATYRVRAGLTGGARVRLESGGNAVELAPGQIEQTLVTAATTMTVKLYGAGSAGTIDAIRLIRVDQTQLLKIDITAGVPDQYGLFKVLGRMRLSTGSFRLRLQYGGPNGTSISDPAVDVAASSGVSLIDMGLMRIPEIDLPTSVGLAAFHWTVNLDYSVIDMMDSYALLDVDEYKMLPIDENYWELEQPAGSGPTLNQYAITDSQPVRDPIDYISANGTDLLLPANHVGGHLLLPAQLNLMIVIVARSRVDHRTGDQYIVDVQRYPRYEAFVG